MTHHDGEYPYYAIPEQKTSSIADKLRRFAAAQDGHNVILMRGYVDEAIERLEALERVAEAARQPAVMVKREGSLMVRDMHEGWEWLYPDLVEALRALDGNQETRPE